jgi:hypothetical protein
MAQHIDDQEWSLVVARVLAVIDLEETARASGALLRRRQVKSASDLLRLALAYGPGGQSLREAAAWAALQGIANLAHNALMKRLRGGADWLAEIAGGLLAARVSANNGKLAERPIRIMDGSVIATPGQATNWRLHAVYDLGSQRFSHLELTDIHGGEALERAAVVPGEIRIGDRGLTHPEGLKHQIEGGGDFVVRVGMRSLRLTRQDGQQFDLAAILAESERSGQADLPVLIGNGQKPQWSPLPARLVVIRKPPEAAANSREKALRESQRGGHKNDPLSLAAAGHLMLITSLAADVATPDQLGALYRLRWQIELAFKRLKSLLHIDRLPAKDPDLVRAFLYAHLIAALLVEDLDPELGDSSPCGPASKAANQTQTCIALATDQDALRRPHRRHHRTTFTLPPSQPRTPHLQASP